MIILATPCTGKTQFAKKSGLKVLDTEQNHFSFIEKDGEAVDNELKFIDYLQHLLNNANDYDYVVTPWDRRVANELQFRGIDFIIVCTDVNIRAEMCRRYREAGYRESYIDFLFNHYGATFSDIMNYPHDKKIVLGRNDYISTAIKNI